jgi:hypothetical protein
MTIPSPTTWLTPLISMQLAGLEAFVCNDFRQGNIILSVQIISAFAPSEDAVTLLFVPPHPSAAKEFHDRYSQFLKKQIEMVTRGALTFVTIDPSYGCNVSALCQEVLISSSP